MKNLKINILVGFLLLAPPQADAQKLSAGPMLGAIYMREAMVWLQADSKGKAVIEYWPDAKPKQGQRTTAVTLNAGEDYSAKIHLTALEPGIAYRYRVLLNGKPATKNTWTFKTQNLWQWRTDPPSFSVLLGSCAFFNESLYDRPGKPYGSEHNIFNAMAEKRPDLTLWLGDNIYFREVDFSPWGLAYRWQRDRATPALQKLLQTGAHLAIWDDHDYGPNDSNMSWVHKGEALKLFQRYWANPSYGLPETPGIFTHFRFNDMDFFLLDSRYHRDHDKMPNTPEKGLFGKQQIRWLKNALLNSTATFKVIVTSGQSLNPFNRFEGWQNFPHERDEFLDWLTKTDINGLLFLSGDRHMTEMLKWERPEHYPLYEVTCSPLTAGPHGSTAEQSKTNLLAGTLVIQRNFCSLDVIGKRDQRKLLIKSHAADGQVIWAHELTALELKSVR